MKKTTIAAVALAALLGACAPAENTNTATTNANKTTTNTTASTTNAATTAGTATTTASPAPGAKPLFERLGGEPAISAVIDDFVTRCAADTRINKKFAKS